jgi:hypothetical protein
MALTGLVVPLKEAQEGYLNPDLLTGFWPPSCEHRADQGSRSSFGLRRSKGYFMIFS